MHKLWRTLALILAATMVVYMIGCGDDDDDTAEPIATTVTATPPGGSTLPANATINLAFDQAVDAVAGATGSGRNWVIPVAATLTITWTNTDGSSGGPVTFNYTLEAEDTTGPTITGGTVSNGDQDVDPEPLNTDGITINFSENVNQGTVVVKTADRDLVWTATWAANSVTVVPNVGQEIGNETEITIEITGVTDTAGNALTGGTITFVTKGKE